MHRYTAIVCCRMLSYEYYLRRILILYHGSDKPDLMARAWVASMCIPMPASVKSFCLSSLVRAITSIFIITPASSTPPLTAILWLCTHSLLLSCVRLDASEESTRGTGVCCSNRLCENLSTCTCTLYLHVCGFVHLHVTGIFLQCVYLTWPPVFNIS